MEILNLKSQNQNLMHVQQMMGGGGYQGKRGLIDVKELARMETLEGEGQWADWSTRFKDAVMARGHLAARCALDALSARQGCAMWHSSTKDTLSSTSGALRMPCSPYAAGLTHTLQASLCSPYAAGLTPTLQTSLIRCRPHSYAAGLTHTLQTSLIRCRPHSGALPMHCTAPEGCMPHRTHASLGCCGEDTC